MAYSSNLLKFDIPLETCLIPTEMKFNRCTLSIDYGQCGVIGPLCIHVPLYSVAVATSQYIVVPATFQGGPPF